MKEINTESFEEINTIENFRGRVGRSVSHVGRRFDRGKIGNKNFGGFRRHGLPKYRRSERSYYRRPYFNTNLSFYNPYYYLFPLYDDNGTVIYNSINNVSDECKDVCFQQCKSDDLKCLTNCYLDCKENFETTSNTFNTKHLFFLIIIILLFFILM